MNADPLLLLAGPSAVSLAPRLAASGYATLDWLSAGPSAHAPEPGESPVAAVLAADQAALIQDLRSRFGAMPILLDLERDSVEARAACLGSGADDFWLSEIGPSDLLLRLRLHRTIQQRSGQRPALLELDDLSVDPANRTVRRGDRVVALTAREFMLLQVLLRRRGGHFCTIFEFCVLLWPLLSLCLGLCTRRAAVQCMQSLQSYCSAQMMLFASPNCRSTLSQRNEAYKEDL